jgi:predicted dehydrogenase
MAAIEAGKHVFCEKPLAMDAQQAREMWSSAQRAGVKTGIQFGHRVAPAAVRMRKLIQDGTIGDIQYIEGSTCYDLGSDPGFPLVWRFSKEIAGAGALGDLGVYAIDAARWLVGEFAAVSGQMRTWIVERPLIPDGHTLHQVIDMYKGGVLDPDADMGQVDNDDECLFLASFASGAQGYFKSSRLYGGEWGIKVYGSRGMLAWEGDKLLSKQHGEETFSVVDVQAPDPAPTIVTQFVANILEGTNQPPTFYDGLQAQEVMDTVIRSAEQGRWVSLPAS